MSKVKLPSSFGTAVREAAFAVNPYVTGNCIANANAAWYLLRSLGYKPVLTFGHAHWRVGYGGGEMVTTDPRRAVTLADGGNTAVHWWNEVGDYIVDTTTNYLPEKLAGLDATDGKSSTCLWSPETLVLRKRDNRQYQSVRDSHGIGLSCYESHGQKIAPDSGDLNVINIFTEMMEAA